MIVKHDSFYNHILTEYYPVITKHIITTSFALAKPDLHVTVDNY